MAVKKQIEDIQGKDAFPCSQQLLIYKGKVLKDETTLKDNSVVENGFLVVMLTKNKATTSAPSATSSASAVQVPTPSLPPAPAPSPAAPASPAGATPAPSAVATPVSAPEVAPTEPPADAYGQAASNLVAGVNLEQTIEQIIDMGGGSWDRDTVIRALRAAYNNPERAVEYLYSGIPDSTEVAVPTAWPPAPTAVTGAAAPVPVPGPVPVPVPVPAPVPAQVTAQVPAAPAAAVLPSAQAPVPPPAAPAQPSPAGGPNAAPLDLFPQGMPGLGGAAAPGALDFLRTNPQFQALRSMVQANPQILQPMLQELGKQNPQLLRLINDNQGEFLRLINEAGAEGGEGDLLGQIAGAMPLSINVTPEEREAIERLEALGFDRARVIEAFLICERNEHMAANYLLENPPDFED